MINWELLDMAFGGDSPPIQYDGTDGDLRKQLQNHGFENPHIEKIISNARLLRRVVGGNYRGQFYGQHDR
ncbi:hypothetical protein [Desulfocucumis palustris]|uniref:hypothetical protein n=1 Tax=Desulfocucumis palustris TaxID=1898651 RepID=UPI000CE9C400|nr:hypothetical protein [Desulfocucumis palustris]